MTRKALDVAEAAAGPSAVVRVGRPIVEGSAICAAIASVVRLVQRTYGRVAAAAPRSQRAAADTAAAGRQLDVITAGSRVVALLSCAVDASVIARRDAGAARLIEPLLRVDLANTIRAIGGVTIIAVITHTLLLAGLGVPVHDVGWAIRASLVAASAIVMRWPGPFAAAWQNRTSKLDVPRP